MWVQDHWSAPVVRGKRGPGGYGRPVPGRVSVRGTCGMYVDGRAIVGTVLRHFILLESNLRDGLYLVRRDTPR